MSWGKLTLEGTERQAEWRTCTLFVMETLVTQENKMAEQIRSTVMASGLIPTFLSKAKCIFLCITSQDILDIHMTKGVCNYKGTFHVSYIDILFFKEINLYWYNQNPSLGHTSLHFLRSDYYTKLILGMHVHVFMQLVYNQLYISI